MQKKEFNADVIAEAISSNVMEAFVEFIHHRVGLIVKFNQRELHKSIESACQTFHLTPTEYLEALQHAKDDSPLLMHLVNAVTIGETYFFRDAAQIKLLHETLLPTIIKKKVAANDYRLRIWSAGCSSGEELYTLVMMLKKLLPDLDRWDCQFLATDINLDAIKKGMVGRYSEWSMRAIPEAYLNIYFEKMGKSYQLHDEIRRLVKFDYLNLVSDTYPALMNGTASQDLILCRNVLIYFDDQDCKSILSRLIKSLADDGLLMLGASDPVMMLDHNLVMVEKMPSVFAKKANPHLNQSIPSVASTVVTSLEPLLPRQETSTPLIIPDLEIDIEDWLRDGKWMEIIDYTNQMAMSEDAGPLLNAKALALANMGRLSEAIETCQASLILDKMNKESYYLYGLLLSESKKVKEAESAFRKALFLDQDYLMCYYQLGMLLIRHHRREEGVKALESAISTLAKFEQTSIVPNSNNLTYAELAELLKAELTLHQQY